MALKLEVVISANDKASNVISKVFNKSGTSAKKFEKTSVKAFANVQESVSSLVKKIAAISATVVSVYKVFDFSKSVIKTADTFEKLRLTLENIEGSAQKAKISFAWIQDFAAKTPYQLEEVTSAFVKMKTYGIDPLQDDALRVAGDVAAAFQGMGKTIDDVVEALADATTGEFERLKEFGIKASKQGEQVVFRYVDIHGKAVEKIVDNNQEVIRSTLLAIWNDKYGGQMNKLSGTWSQMVSNIQDNWTRFKQLIAESGFFKYMKDNLKTVLDWSNSMFETGQAQKWANVISKSLILLMDMAKGVFEVFKTVTTGIYNSFVGAFKGIREFVKKIFTEEGFFESMIDAFIAAVKTLPKIFIKGLGIISMQVIKWASELFRPIIIAVEWVVDNIVRAFKRAINSIKKVFIDLKNWIAEKLSFEKEIFGKKIEFKLFDKTEYEPIFKEAETQYVSFKKKAEEVNKEQEQLIKNLSKWQSDLWSGVKKDYKEALKQIRESGKAGKIIADGIESYVSGTENLISRIGQKVDELKAKGVNGVDEIRKIINTSAEEFKKNTEETKKKLEELNQKAKDTKNTTSSFWDEFIKGVEKSNSKLAMMIKIFKSLYDKASDFFKRISWDKVKSFGSNAWEGLKSLFSGGAKEGETGILSRVKNSISSTLQGAQAGGWIGATAAFFTDQLMQNKKVQAALDKIFGAIQKILEPIADVIAPVIESIAPVIESFKPIFQLIAELLKPVAWILRNIADGIAKLINFFFSIAKPVWEGIKKALDAIKDIVEGIKNAIKNVGGFVGDVVGGVGDFIGGIVGGVGDFVGGFIDSLHSGGPVKPVVAHSGMYIGKLRHDEVPAILQTGEYVINRQATKKYKPILEAINKGQIPTGNININVNVYAKNFDRRFVENELVPLLEDLNRRGKIKW